MAGQLGRLELGKEALVKLSSLPGRLKKVGQRLALVEPKILNGNFETT